MDGKTGVSIPSANPFLAGFTILFSAAAFASFAVYALSSDVFWFRAGYFADLAGVMMCLAAALPGFVNRALAVPGQIRFAMNACAVVLLASNAVLMAGRFGDAKPDAAGSIPLTLLGFSCTIIAARRRRGI